ncbi:helix-turn-helix domain-containing protein [Phascolarctobacterium succinatutens]|uniref:helix-turn-helix domain-containing protein n=1 Tax=Phascolarctobacterium succinatutens TaxID=626940 RepID=UPI003AB38574
MDMFDFLEATPDEINKGIAVHVRTVRKRRKISQVRLSEKSGVSLGSVKRFESTGEISLLSLTKIAIALNVEQELKQLFSNVPYMSLEEIENERNQQD